MLALFSDTDNICSMTIAIEALQDSGLNSQDIEYIHSLIEGDDTQAREVGFSALRLAYQDDQLALEQIEIASPKSQYWVAARELARAVSAGDYQLAADLFRWFDQFYPNLEFYTQNDIASYSGLRPTDKPKQTIYTSFKVPAIR